MRRREHGRLVGDALLPAEARKARDGVYPRCIQAGAATAPLVYLEVLRRPDAPALLLRHEHRLPSCDLSCARIKRTLDTGALLRALDRAGILTGSFTAEPVEDGFAAPAGSRDGLVERPRVRVQHVHLHLAKQA
eukprot:2758173-Prymnesium_polylepis.1